MSTYVYVCVYIYIIPSAQNIQTKVPMWYIVGSANFFLWCSLASLKSKAKPNRAKHAKPSRDKSEPHRRNKTLPPWLGSFFSSRLGSPSQTEASQTMVNCRFLSETLTASAGAEANSFQLPTAHSKQLETKGFQTPYQVHIVASIRLTAERTAVNQ